MKQVYMYFVGIVSQRKKIEVYCRGVHCLNHEVAGSILVTNKRKEMIFSTSLDISNEVKHDCPSRASTHPRFPHVQIADAQLSPQCANSAILLTDSTQPRHN